MRRPLSNLTALHVPPRLACALPAHAEVGGWDVVCAGQEARKYLHGFSREELEGVIRQSFEQADVDGSGTLDAEEFRQCIRTADVGLTRQEANMLMAFADADGDGKVSYDEFVPICFDLLVEVVSNDLLRSKKTETAQAIEEYLLAIWAEADHGRTGSLAPRVLSRLIREADLGLTHVQVRAPAPSRRSSAPAPSRPHRRPHRIAARTPTLTLTLSPSCPRRRPHRIAASTRLGSTCTARLDQATQPTHLITPSPSPHHARPPGSPRSRLRRRPRCTRWLVTARSSTTAPSTT